MSERKNPYTQLQSDCRSWAYSVVYPQRKTMWMYEKAKLSAGWSLHDTYERVAAAKTLGWRVELDAREDGLYIVYVKVPADPPWAIKV